MSKSKFPRLFVETYEKGLVCGGEVFNQYLDHVSETNVDEWMLELTPELLARFQNSIQDFNPNPADYVFLTATDIAKWRHAAQLMRVWFQQRRSEPDAPPNGGPTTPSGDRRRGGPPSAS